jgi:hypothetical protein
MDTSNYNYINDGEWYTKNNIERLSIPIPNTGARDETQIYEAIKTALGFVEVSNLGQQQKYETAIKKDRKKINEIYKNKNINLIINSLLETRNNLENRIQILRGLNNQQLSFIKFNEFLKKSSFSNNLPGFKITTKEYVININSNNDNKIKSMLKCIKSWQKVDLTKYYLGDFEVLKKLFGLLVDNNNSENVIEILKESCILDKLNINKDDLKQKIKDIPQTLKHKYGNKFDNNIEIENLFKPNDELTKPEQYKLRYHYFYFYLLALLEIYRSIVSILSNPEKGNMIGTVNKQLIIDRLNSSINTLQKYFDNTLRKYYLYSGDKIIKKVKKESSSLTSGSIENYDTVFLDDYELKDKLKDDFASNNEFNLICKILFEKIFNPCKEENYVLKSGQKLFMGGLILADPGACEAVFEVLKSSKANIIKVRETQLKYIDGVLSKTRDAIHKSQLKRITAELEGKIRDLLKHAGDDLENFYGTELVNFVVINYRKYATAFGDNIVELLKIKKLLKLLRNSIDLTVDFKKLNERRLKLASKLIYNQLLKVFYGSSVFNLYNEIRNKMILSREMTQDPRVNYLQYIAEGKNKVDENVSNKIESAKYLDNNEIRQLLQVYTMSNTSVRPSSIQASGKILTQITNTSKGKVIKKEFWNAVKTRLSGKTLFIPYSTTFSSGLLDIVQSGIDGKLIRIPSYKLTLSSIKSSVIPKGKVIVTGTNNEINDIEKWRTMKNKDIKALQSLTTDDLRLNLYDIIGSLAGYNAKTPSMWSGSTAFKRQFVNYCSKAKNCQAITSQKEAAKQIANVNGVRFM